MKSYAEVVKGIRRPTNEENAISEAISSTWIPSESLPFSPSLVDILGFLKHSDILNCKLVCHQLYDVIKRHDILMPRKTIDVLYANILGTSSKEVNVSLSVPHSIKFWITNKRISVHGNLNRYIVDFMNTHGKKTHLKFPCQYAIDGTTGSVESSMDFVVNGMEEGLRLVLTMILRRYYLRAILLGENAAELTASLTEVARKCRTKCKNLFLRIVPWQGFERFCSIIGSTRNIYIEGSLSEILPTIARCRIKIETTGVQPLEPIIELIERWTKGAADIYRIHMIGVFGWSHNDLLEALGGLAGVAIFHDEVPVDNAVDVVFKRDSDSAILYLHHGKQLTQLLIWEPTETPVDGRLPRNYIPL